MNIQSESGAASPLFSVVTAIYNVAPYLPDYLKSLESQTFPHDRLQIVLVDDGSTDDSLEIIEEWKRQVDANVLILTKQNGGQASARNLGLEHATGDWITFCDPDDYIAEDYFSVLSENIEADTQGLASMLATHLITHDEVTGRIADTHALRRRFRDGDRIVDLLRSPDFFHMSAGTAVLRREHIELHGLRFEESLRFSFEDAHFISSYLLRLERPTISYVASAKYFYRKRAAGDSAVQTGSLKREKYTDVLLYGHIDLVEQAKSRYSQVPLWLQFLLLYDVFWYFRGDRRPGAPSRLLDDATLDEFHRLIARVIEGISEEAIYTFDVMGTDRELRDALLLGYKYPDARASQVVVERVDTDQKLTLLRYQYSGATPNEEIRVKGLRVAPRWAKSQSVAFFGRTLFSRRYLWIPATGTFSVTLDGTPTPLELGRERRPVYVLRPYKVSKALAGMDITARTRKQPPGSRTRKARLQRLIMRSLREGKTRAKKIRHKAEHRRNPEIRAAARVRKLASRGYIAHRYKNAWILMDRVDRANDNAEHLYRYIRQQHPDVNIWFVLLRKSPDWERLHKEGFRLLEYGSIAWKAALLHADHHISSHLDKFITNPLDPKHYGKMRWKFTFLQHGITKDDQSKWFNTKKIDLLITASNAEHLSIVGDGTSYVFTEREVQLTGFPRHDALLSVMAKGQDRSRILLTPTWRSWLAGEVTTNGQRLKVDGFAESEYAGNWRTLCQSEDLREFAKARGLKISMLPHPSLAEYLHEMELPSHVELLTWDDMPFSQLLATSAVVVTDYSSTAFDAAYAELPLVYFQFDRERVLAGEHIYEKGYFDYDKHGFGPVAPDVLTAVSSIEEALAGDHSKSEYATRRAQTFPYRDGANSERVFKAIRSIRKEVPFSRAVQVLEFE
ncbi:bifunctional glycosyltransferase/CDP-glycerol:glycerophosphate glycerophosphotransferase [Arthrobacter crystallopoietes]|uniref:bifunctional glycosyltransferase/CDP-glycerol:glycerophosphate glycerophosphotransferase n=1 Tax=Crystallibacter crystallopoietes TaxID=37928 RepID=UPI001486A03B|nr:CDP-glycerol glycerophosphotransferase family protein [Arthrobacter crystallopoietes]